MGATHVTVTVRNMNESSRSWDGLFLVDTGASDCLVPRKYLEQIGIESDRKRTYELADGSLVSFNIGWAQIEFMGESIYAKVIFGDDNTEPILGVIALEMVGIEVDPVNQRLKRLPALRLKSIK